ncbi:MAG: homoserine O-acetyltransferase/O-succinyltransferase family protein [Capsulimonadaceae bacterium]
MKVLRQTGRTRVDSFPRAAGRRIAIGLLNNMPDEALRVTEKQFRSLIYTVADGIDIDVRMFALRQTPRSPTAREYLEANCEGISILDSDLDGLVVTGAAPSGLQALQSSSIRWLLDAPVTNSGRLQARMQEASATNGWKWKIESSISPDHDLRRTDAVAVTSNAVTLDRTGAWTNIAGVMLDPTRSDSAVPIPNLWIVDLSVPSIQ